MNAFSDGRRRVLWPCSMGLDEEAEGRGRPSFWRPRIEASSRYYVSPGDLQEAARKLTGTLPESGRREPYGSRRPRHRTCRSAYGGSRRVAPELVSSARDPLSASPYLGDSVPYLGRRPSEEASAQDPTEKRPGAPRQVRPFAGVRPVSMASADSWQFIDPPLGGPSPQGKPPGLPG
jgi:hypothetical protein